MAFNLNVNVARLFFLLTFVTIFQLSSTKRKNKGNVFYIEYNKPFHSEISNSATLDVVLNFLSPPLNIVEIFHLKWSKLKQQ